MHCQTILTDMLRTEQTMQQKYRVKRERDLCGCAGFAVKDPKKKLMFSTMASPPFFAFSTHISHFPSFPPPIQTLSLVDPMCVLFLLGQHIDKLT